MPGPLRFGSAVPHMGAVFTAAPQVRVNTRPNRFQIDARQSAVRQLGIEIVPIQAPAWAIEKLRPYLLTWLRRYAGAGNKALRATVRTWKKKPRFAPAAGAAHYDRAAGMLSIIIGTDDKLYVALNNGVRSHTIMPRAANIHDARGNPSRARAWRFKELDSAGRVIREEVRSDPRPRLAFIVPFRARTTPGQFSSGQTSGGKQGYRPGTFTPGYNPDLRRPYSVGIKYTAKFDAKKAWRMTIKTGREADLKLRAWHVTPRAWDVMLAGQLQEAMTRDITPFVRGMLAQIEAANPGMTTIQYKKQVNEQRRTRRLVGGGG